VAESPTEPNAADPAGSGPPDEVTRPAGHAKAPEGRPLRAGTADRPGRPAGPRRRPWQAAARRTLSEFKNDFLQDRSAALTYYGVLAIFPGILVLLSLLGVFGRSATQPLITNLAGLAPRSVRTMLLGAVSRLQHGQSAAGVVAIAGLILALWSTSSYVAAFMRAANAIYDVPEGRPVWKTLPIRLGVTLLLMVLLVASAVIVVVSGSLAGHVGQVLGIGSAAVHAWGIAKWPVLLIIVCLMVGVLYWASPNARQDWRSISPGAAVAVVIWMAASGLFALYVANFGHYDKVYGSIAGMIIFLIWLWISNIAILLGAEFNAELERGRAIAAGAPPDAEPFVQMRDTRKLHRHRRAGRAAS
jgi:membrane protein